MRLPKVLPRVMALVLVLCMLTPAGSWLPVGAWAQDQNAPPPVPPEELEQMLSPIALYPDGLLAQVLMASTYPLEIVQAARWVKENPKLKDEEAEAALKKKSWDPSVKSLIPFPQVLEMMDKNVEWTQKLGDTFLAQQKDIMETVQRLRAKAEAAGNLKSTNEQTVVVEKTTETKIIKIEPATEVVYVPVYNPTVVYATPYPATVVYPPAYYPPGYVATAAFVSFGVGVAMGAAMYGGFHWGGHGDYDVTVNRNYNVNRPAPPASGTRPPAGQRPAAGSRPVNTQARPGGAGPTSGDRSSWQHNPQHRQGVPYKAVYVEFDMRLDHWVTPIFHNLTSLRRTSAKRLQRVEKFRVLAGMLRARLRPASRPHPVVTFALYQFHTKPACPLD